MALDDQLRSADAAGKLHRSQPAELIRKTAGDMEVEVCEHCGDILQAFVHCRGNRWRLAYCREDGSYNVLPGHNGLNQFELAAAKELLEEALRCLKETATQD